MKNRKWLPFYIVGALLILVLPLSVLAGEPQDVKVYVKNTTGGTVDLLLTDPNGVPQWFSLWDQNQEITLTEGKYNYYASTVCGVQAGVWNVNVGKRLLISCPDDQVVVDWYNIGQNRCDRCHNAIGHPLD